MLSLSLCPFAGNAAAETARDGFGNAVAAYRAGDHGRALEGWRGLADEGNPLAQYNVGLLHYQGHGTTRSYAQALIWFHAAARQGLAASYLRLGAMFEGGEGVPRDLEQAYLWYTLAVSAFGPGPCRDKALDRRRLLAKNLTEAQVLKVLAESSEWAPGPLAGAGQPCFKSIATRPEEAPAPAAVARDTKTAAVTAETIATAEKEESPKMETALLSPALMSKLPAKLPGGEDRSNVAGLASTGAQQGPETKLAAPLPTVEVAKRKVHMVRSPDEGKTPIVGAAPRKTAPPKEQMVARATASPRTAAPGMVMPKTSTPSTRGAIANPGIAPEKQKIARTTPPAHRAKRTKKGVYVQLGALSTRKMADQVWRRLRKRNGDIFGERQRKIEKMRTSSGKALYRLYAGPFDNGGKADAFCDTLKERDEACFIPPKFRNRN